MKIVEIQKYGGIDWHDSKKTTSYLKENGQYNITDPKKVIEEDVVKSFKSFYDNVPERFPLSENEEPIPDKRPSIDEIRTAVRNGQKVSAGINGVKYRDEEGQTTIYYDYYDAEMTWKPEDQVLVRSYAAGQFTDYTWYVERDIPDENVRYLVAENFLCPNKGVPSVARFYHLPYKTQEEAEKALEDLKLHEYDGKNVWANSIKELLIIDMDETPNTTWYALNIQAIRAEENLRKTLKRYNMPEEIPFKMYAEQHIKALEEADKNAYKAEIARYQAKTQVC